MMCEKCSKNPATVHLTHVRGNVVEASSFCATCADRAHLTEMGSSILPLVKDKHLRLIYRRLLSLYKLSAEGWC